MSKKLTWIGIAITVAYLIAAAQLGWGKWDQFSAMKPNEVGDFLAGIVGPLALLWLILGYFQQGEELRLSTEALRQQAEELKQSVEHQHALAEATRRQVEVQLEAFAQDRKKERDALRPKMWLSTNGYSISGGITVANFKLENSGHRARDVMVECLLANRQLPTRVYPILKEDSVVELAVEGLRRDDIGTVRFVITSVDGAGERGITEFPGVVQPVASNGVRVVLSQSFERSDG
ncbi:hypothetical protein [Achromobacter xylosoxidans]|uniref:hypothetical protein n=1 Tax=Alcaligenes xylosoxydans xylosoxydans TaxID=85698 RepID=UPI0006C6FDAE|nr:hypothetical protein [Achromobacter xylosoxidans]CUJ55254.1 Uncharacterised protein [Achromobacter xylosoxidans]